MGPLFFFFISWWKLVLMAVAIVHFIRRRPDTYWLFVILFLGWIGALVYIVVEVIPDAGLLRSFFSGFSAPPPHSRTGTRDPRQSFGGEL